MKTVMAIPRTRATLRRRRQPSRRVRPRATQEFARYLVGGVNSPVRAFRRVAAEPFYVQGGRGASVVDVLGETFTDLVMGWGALILGHAHPRVGRAVRRQMIHGHHFGLTHLSELTLAKLIVEAMPSIEQVRFTASGTEACMTAIRLARAYSHRSKLLTFEGCYHGHHDGLLVKRGSGLATFGLSTSAGVPASLTHDTIVVPYHHREALEEAFATSGQDLACVILEPAAANMGVVVPSRQFLERLRTLTQAHETVLIFDEVVTGFRVAYGGAQQYFGVTPDLTVLGKIIGGGFPIGAVGGSRRIMRLLAPEGPVYHAGTFAGHPIAMTAGAETLTVLKQAAPYAFLDALGERLAAGLRQSARRAQIPLQVNRLGSMLTAFFSSRPVTHFGEAQQANTDQFSHLANGLRQRGVLIPPSPFEAMFLSTAHTSDLIDIVIQRASEVLATGS